MSIATSGLFRPGSVAQIPMTMFAARAVPRDERTAAAARAKTSARRGPLGD